MRMSSAARQFVTYLTLSTLLIVGVLLLASAAPLYAEPAAMQPVNWFASPCGASPAPRNGFLLPTLAVPVHGASSRLVVTQSALRGTLPMHVAPTTGQAQATPKPQKSWFRRNWWWVVPIGVVVTWVIGVSVYCSSNPSMCDD